MKNYHQLSIGKKVLQFIEQYPVVTITGPGQSGKTTLCRMLFPDRAYVSLEDPEQREFAHNDPGGFYPRIFDKKLNPTEALGFYVNIYIERDIRHLIPF